MSQRPKAILKASADRQDLVDIDRQTWTPGIYSTLSVAHLFRSSMRNNHGTVVNPKVGIDSRHDLVEPLSTSRTKANP